MDLDLLDEGSEDEIQSLTLEERTKPFVKYTNEIVA